VIPVNLLLAVLQEWADRASTENRHSEAEECLARLSLQTPSQADAAAQGGADSQASPNDTCMRFMHDDANVQGCEEMHDSHARTAMLSLQEEACITRTDLYLHAQATVWLAGEPLQAGDAEDSGVNTKHDYHSIPGESCAKTSSEGTAEQPLFWDLSHA
jgi:hypothetical protein